MPDIDYFGRGVTDMLKDMTKAVDDLFKSEEITLCGQKVRLVSCEIIRPDIALVAAGDDPYLLINLKAELDNQGGPADGKATEGKTSEETDG